MFPLKRRRKFLRVSDLNITVKVMDDTVTVTKKLVDISASGCKLDNIESINVSYDNINIVFNFEGSEFNIKVNFLRDSCFEFVFDNDLDRGTLNKVLLKEYFKDTPELLL